jgi:hypothetical protein
MLWEALVETDVPQALVEVSADPSNVVNPSAAASVDTQGEGLDPTPSPPAGTVLGSPGRYVPPAAEEGDLGKSREAFNFNGNQFIAVGGCAISPTFGAPSYTNQVSGSPFCMPNASGDFSRVLNSRDMRTHTHLQIGGAIIVQISNSGTVTANFPMTQGAYIKTWSFDPPHCTTRCCGSWPFQCFTSCTKCGIIDSKLHGATILQSAGDLYHFGGTWYTNHDERTDMTPWL